MSAFSNTAFSTSAFSVGAFDIGTPSVVTSTTVTGGGFYFDFDRAMAQKHRRNREQEERELQDIEDATTREIAKLLRVQEAKDAERADLARLQALADRYAQRGVDVPRPILASVMKANEERTRNALEQLQREIQQMLDEEEQAIVSLLLLDD